MSLVQNLDLLLHLQYQLLSFQTESKCPTRPTLRVTDHHPSLQFPTTSNPPALAVETPVSKADVHVHASCPQSSSPVQLSAKSPHIPCFCSPQTVEPGAKLNRSSHMRHSNTPPLDVTLQQSFETKPHAVCQQLECQSSCSPDTTHTYCNCPDLSIKSWVSPPPLSCPEQREALEDVGAYAPSGNGTHLIDIQKLPKGLSAENDKMKYCDGLHSAEKTPLTAAVYINAEANPDMCRKSTTECAAGIEGDLHEMGDVEMATVLLNVHNWECSKHWNSVPLFQQE